MKVFSKIEKFSTKPALIYKNGTKISYKQLTNLTDKFSTYLTGKKKKLVFVLCKNNIETVIGYVGTLRSNNVALLLSADIDNELLSNLTQIYKPNYFWEPKELNTLKSKVTYEYNGYHLVQNPKPLKAKLHPDLNLLLSTSGSTGSPKLVRLSGTNVMCNARSIVKYLHITSSEKAITTLPLNYTYGLSILNSHLIAGAALLLTEDSIVNKGFWGFFREYKATSFAGVPYTYETLKKIGFFTMNLPSLKYMTQAGGKLSADLVHEYAQFTKDKGIKFFVMYGQTEATARIAYLPPKYNLKYSASVGIPIPGGKLSIRDLNNGKTITKPLVDGELVYKGKNVMMGYALSPKDLEKGDELNGTLMTGDIAHFDDRDLFYITGRRKRFLKIMGVLFSLDDLEAFLKGKGYDCICGGKDDALYIATTTNNKDKELKKTLQNKYRLNPSVMHVICVESIKRSDSGKPRHEEIFKDIVK